jgi:hypothetical protein
MAVKVGTDVGIGHYTGLNESCIGKIYSGYRPLRIYIGTGITGECTTCYKSAETAETNLKLFTYYKH